ncbi:MAG: hypothetical protein ACLFQV_13300 [Vulcanimicrobiota bacterium]
MDNSKETKNCVNCDNQLVKEQNEENLIEGYNIFTCPNCNFTHFTRKNN